MTQGALTSARESQTHRLADLRMSKAPFRKVPQGLPSLSCPVQPAKAGTGWVSPLCSTSLVKTPGARNSHGRAPSYRTLGNELVHSQPSISPCCHRAAHRPSRVGSAHRLAASRRCCALGGSAAHRELALCFSE